MWNGVGRQYFIVGGELNEELYIILTMKIFQI